MQFQNYGCLYSLKECVTKLSVKINIFILFFPVSYIVLEEIEQIWFKYHLLYFRYFKALYKVMTQY